MNELNSSPPNRMARRKSKTRHQLMDAAISQLLEKGYEDLMTDEITDAADVGRRTFYNHFVNKRDCVSAAVHRRFTHYAEEVVGRFNLAPDNSAAEVTKDQALVVAIMASQMFLAIATDPLTRQLMLYPRILTEAIGESQRDFLTENLANGLASERFQPDLMIETLEPVVTWGFTGLVIASINRESQAEDSLAWAHFLLFNLGVVEQDIQSILAQLRQLTAG